MELAGKIMTALAIAGHKSFIVGGAVRDMLRGVPAADIDIATSAVPEEIAAIASIHGWKSVAIGAAFGVVAVVAEGSNYEIATFRSECYGADSHRPETVKLGVSLREDLARRDFTINAMAMDADGRIIDLFGGREDLAVGVIRTVGHPNERFAEDGLRMFRAARFAARFGFTLETSTMAAISCNLERVNGLSVERIQTEIEKTLMADFASQGLAILLKTGLIEANCQVKERGQANAVPILPELSHLNGLLQNPKYHLYDAWQHTLAAVDLMPREVVLRWAALLHDIAKGLPGVRALNREGKPSDPGHDRVGAELAAGILGRLRVERQVAERVVWLIRHHLTFPKAEEKAVLKWLKNLFGNFKNSKQFSVALEQLFLLHQADRLAGHTQPDIEGLEAVRCISTRILLEIPFFPAQLALRGQEIAAKLGDGVAVGRFQQNLLERIQAGQLSNTQSALAAALDARARRMVQKW